MDKLNQIAVIMREYYDSRGVGLEQFARKILQLSENSETQENQIDLAKGILGHFPFESYCFLENPKRIELKITVSRLNFHHTAMEAVNEKIIANTAFRPNTCMLLIAPNVLDNWEQDLSSDFIHGHFILRK